MSVFHRISARMNRAWTGAADSRTVTHAGAAAWGFAEGTLLFVVPDVWLSAVALRRPRRAVTAVASTTAGALLGGAVTYRWARRAGASESKYALSMVPGVSLDMVDRVQDDLRSRGWSALLTGPLRGEPYKLFARAAAVNGLPLGELMFWSVPARIPRFLLLALIGGAAGNVTRRVLPTEAVEKLTYPTFCAVWAGFYAWYLTKGPGRDSPGFGSGFGLELPRLPFTG